MDTHHFGTLSRVLQLGSTFAQKLLWEKSICGPAAKIMRVKVSLHGCCTNMSTCQLSHTPSLPQGLLSFADEPRQMVLQGVYEVYETTPTLPWGDRDRVNRLVVIGNHISREQLHHSFLSCLLSEGQPS